MRGEELQGLKIEELIELEELLEAGLCSIVEEKVCFIELWLWHFRQTLTCWNFFWFQAERIRRDQWPPEKGQEPNFEIFQGIPYTNF